MSDYINQDLVASILKSLPVKSLLRFRIICKSWKELIDSQLFIVDHLAAQKPKLIAQNRPYEYLIIDPHGVPKFDTLSAPIDEDDEGDISSYVVNSVHGVICIYEYHYAILICNPSIYRFLRIPLPDFPNCTLSKDYCGFWIDPANNNMKVVIICFEEMKVVLYSSTNLAWTEIDMGERKEYGSCRNNRQVLINGIAYWTAYDRLPWHGVIVYFDFLQERFGSFSLPDRLGSMISCIHVCKWRDCLSLVHWLIDRCHVWAMIDGRWCMVNAFRLNYVTECLYVEESHKRYLVQTRKGHLVLYDPKVRTKSIRLRSEFMASTPLSIAYEFVESLVFPYI